MSRFENHGGEIAHFNPEHFAYALNEVYHSRWRCQVVPHFSWYLDPLVEHLGRI
jgi:hypothetical protein